VTLRNGVISGLFCWLGFVITTMLVNNSFAMRDEPGHDGGEIIQLSTLMPVSLMTLP
jgi:hypothetical protein